MTLHRFLLAAAALAAAIVVAPEARQPPVRDQRPFRSGIEITSITATVTDREGRLVAGLGRNAFDVYEDGERQRVTQFTAERVPISLGVLLDVSDSMFGRRIQEARAAVEHFLFDLLRSDDEYLVVAFNHTPHPLSGWTTTPDVVRRGLEALRPSGGTAVYDAVIDALPLVERRTRQRAALLIISDGADTASNATVRDVRRALLGSDAFVYAIAIDPPGQQAINTRVNPDTLRTITNDSGGRTEIVRSAAEIAAATSRIAEELNSQYVLGYTSPRGADGKYHSIRVRVGDSDFRVRARNGYVAAPVPRRER